MILQLKTPICLLLITDLNGLKRWNHIWQSIYIEESVSWLFYAFFFKLFRFVTFVELPYFTAKASIEPSINWVCELCGKVLKFRNNLNDHVQSAHTGDERPHKCDICNARWASVNIHCEHYVCGNLFFLFSALRWDVIWLCIVNQATIIENSIVQSVRKVFTPNKILVDTLNVMLGHF